MRQESDVTFSLMFGDIKVFFAFSDCFERFDLGELRLFKSKLFVTKGDSK